MKKQNYNEEGHLYFNDLVTIQYQNKTLEGIIVGRHNSTVIVGIHPDKFGENVPQHIGVYVLLAVKEEDITKV